MPKKCSVLFLLAALPLAALTLPATLRGQELLTVDSALRIAHDSSRIVHLAVNDADIARNNNTLGNAGFLPRLDFTAGVAGTLNDTHQQLATGEFVTWSSATGSTAGAGLGITWTVFDGFRMFNQRDELKLQQQLGELNVSTTTETVDADVIRAYFNVVLQQMGLQVIAEAVSTSEDRVKNVQLKYDVGENAKPALLQAKVDLNADRSSLLRQQVLLANAKTEMNTVLARASNTPFRVVDTIVVAGDLVYDDLRREALANNRDISAARLEVSLAQTDRKLVEADRYPKVGVNLGYNFSQVDNQVGSVATNKLNGVAYGATLSMNLFNGFNTNREAENAEIRIRSSQLDLAEAEQQVESGLLQAYTSYRNRLDVVALERDNVTLARENFNLSMERYKVGAIIPLELREAQNTYVEAESRLLSAEYDAKLAETDLLRLSGRLVP